MAFMTTMFCDRCKKSVRVSNGQDTGPFGHCPKCRKEEADIETKAHFDALDKLTIEERLRKVEKWIHNYRPPNNIEMRF